MHGRGSRIPDRPQLTRTIPSTSPDCPAGTVDQSHDVLRGGVRLHEFGKAHGVELAEWLVVQPCILASTRPEGSALIMRTSLSLEPFITT